MIQLVTAIARLMALLMGLPDFDNTWACWTTPTAAVCEYVQADRHISISIERN
jgi:hypothetical protein